MIVCIIWQKPVLTHASIVCEGMLASVNSVKRGIGLLWAKTETSEFLRMENSEL